jgi:hypothetical protein
MRPAAAATAFSDIQFAMGGFINPAQVLNDGAGDVTVQFPPIYALLLTPRLTRTPMSARSAVGRGNAAGLEDLPHGRRCDLNS